MKSKRQIKRNEQRINEHMKFFVNKFIKFAEQNRNNIEAIASKLSEVDREWKNYCFNFNKKSNLIKLNPKAFLQVVNFHLNKISDAAKKTNISNSVS